MTIRRHGTLTPAAQLQQGLWGTDPQGWAELAEPHSQPLFEALLDATATRSGTRLLDIGCGSGLLMSLAAGRGASVAGVDVSPGLLAVAAVGVALAPETRTVKPADRPAYGGRR